MSEHYGWTRGDTAHYHAAPNGPVSIRDCVLIEDPFYVAAWRGWFVLLDRVVGPVPFRQISAPSIDGIQYSQQFAFPELLPDYLHTAQPPEKTAFRPPEDPDPTPHRSPDAQQ